MREVWPTESPLNLRLNEASSSALKMHICTAMKSKRLLQYFLTHILQHSLASDTYEGLHDQPLHSLLGK